MYVANNHVLCDDNQYKAIIMHHRASRLCNCMLIARARNWRHIIVQVLSIRAAFGDTNKTVFYMCTILFNTV